MNTEEKTCLMKESEVDDDIDFSTHQSWKKYPELFDDLDLSKNSDLTFFGEVIHVLKLSAGTGKKLDWKCSNCCHEWKSTGSNRVNGNGCPACRNLEINNYDKRNSMAKTHPRLAVEYQGDASTIVAGTNQNLHWKCSICEHHWIAAGNSRVFGHGCGFCNRGFLHSDGRNSLAKTHPDLAKEYLGDATKIIAGTNDKLDWKCIECAHQWKVSGDNRVKGTGCPVCANKAVHIDGRNSLAKTHPELAKECLDEATKFTSHTKKILNWRCKNCSHEWKSTGSNRASGNGCPACVNQAIHIDGRNSMAITHPDLAKEYLGDATKIIAGTNDKLDWKCIVCEHEWQSIGSNRVKGNGCPVCSNRVVHIDGHNSMIKTHPELAKEFLGDASQVIAGTNIKLDWKCSNCEYEWKAAGSDRVSGNGCPVCAKYGYDPSIIGYVYLHHYNDGTKDWLKCGITNHPSKRFAALKQSAQKSNIVINQLNIFKFDDGYNARQCEIELLSIKRLRFESGYDVAGKNEFFKYESLEEIKKIIFDWL